VTSDIINARNRKGTTVEKLLTAGAFRGSADEISRMKDGAGMFLVNLIGFMLINLIAVHKHVTYRGKFDHTLFVRFLKICVVALLTVSCQEGTTRAEVSAKIIPWQIDLRAPTFQAIDLTRDFHRNSRDQNPNLTFHTIESVRVAQQMLENLPEMEKNDDKIEEVGKIIGNALASWLVTDEMLSFVRLNPPFDRLNNNVRMGKIETENYYWFSIAVEVKDVKIAVIGVPQEGLVEVCIICPYDRLDEFNELAHYYLNLSENDKAFDDYRPTRISMTAMGDLGIDSSSYETEGYIIKIGVPGRSGVVRSFTREFITDDEKVVELTTIEFSISMECSSPGP